MKHRLYSYSNWRLPEDKFITYLHRFFGISVEDKYGRYTGFIKKDVCFDIYVPKITNGEFSLKYEECERKHAYNITHLKQVIKELIAEEPERMETLYNYFAQWRKEEII